MSLLQWGLFVVKNIIAGFSQNDNKCHEEMALPLTKPCCNISLKPILNFHIAKCPLPITYSSVAQSFFILRRMRRWCRYKTIGNGCYERTRCVFRVSFVMEGTPYITPVSQVATARMQLTSPSPGQSICVSVTDLMAGGQCLFWA